MNAFTESFKDFIDSGAKVFAIESADWTSHFARTATKDERVDIVKNIS